MIHLHTSSNAEVTLLSNTFIDNYMPKANGEFVKVYIYLLRLLSIDSFGLEQMADCLLCTERDILRALKYWEEKGLLSLEYTAGSELTGILLLAPGAASETSSPAAAAPEPVSEPVITEALTVSVPEKKSPQRQPLTKSRLKELKQNEEIRQLLYIAEQYLGKTLTPAETEKLLFFYDGLKLSPDLIEYLIEYSVSRNHKSMRYIETVAIAWAEEGIATVAMAKEANSRYAKEYYTILKALGLGNRNPVEGEISLINTWLHTYGFSMDIILEACRRTVLQTGQGSFPYTDKILTDWKGKGVKHPEDILRLDTEHRKRRQEKAEKRSSTQPQASKNRFNNFEQRDYDFDELEKKLLTNQDR